jgi:hypothetical protein
MERFRRFERLKRFRQLTLGLCQKKKGIKFSRKMGSEMSLFYLENLQELGNVEKIIESTTQKTFYILKEEGF